MSTCVLCRGGRLCGQWKTSDQQYALARFVMITYKAHAVFDAWVPEGFGKKHVRMFTRQAYHTDSQLKGGNGFRLSLSITLF